MEAGLGERDRQGLGEADPPRGDGDTDVLGEDLVPGDQGLEPGEAGGDHPHDVVEATLDLDLEALRLRPEDRDASGAVEVEDLLTGQRWQWGRTPYVRLDPHVEPAHVLRIVRNG